MNPTELPEWSALAQRRRALDQVRIPALFQSDPKREERFRFEAATLVADLSRNFLDTETMSALVALARATGLEARRDALLGGAIVNPSEQRPAWHTALRTAPADGATASRLAMDRERFLQFAQALRAGQVRGAGGEAIDTVVCIGIGGSDLGPRLVTEALGPSSGPRVMFASNLDSADLQESLRRCAPATTLFACISKSFSTLETMENLGAALAWLKAEGPGLAPASHLAAVTSQPERACAFGIDPERIFTFPDWVGGRFSLWSACGIGIAVAHGREAFEDLLEGAGALDAHFAQAPLESNLPTLLGMLGLWYVNFWGVNSRAVIPYAHRLRKLPAYLQQLEMESLGKRVDLSGRALAIDTGPVVWGEVGSNAQHSVFQWLHQGTGWIPLDILLVAANDESSDARLRQLNQFARAQADALAWGDALLGAASPPPHAACCGNRPSTLISLPRLDARSIGALLALHEHRVFVQSVAWSVNAFDQWGVEIGKRLMALRNQGSSVRQ